MVILAKALRFSGLSALLAIGVAVGFDLSGFGVPSALLWVVAGVALLWAVLAVVVGRALVYVFKRLLEAAVTVWVIATATFFLLRFLPGGPFDQERAMAPEVRAAIEAKYGLDQPVLSQYGQYLADLIRLDLGLSYKYINRNVTDIIVETLPVSFQLGFYSMLLAFLVGVPVGLWAARHQNSWIDYSLMAGAISSVALPSFMVGPLLIYIFAFGYFLPGGGFLPAALWDSPLHYILPVVTLGLRPAAVIARMTRASVLDVITSDYVRTARSKGLAEAVVLYKHVLKNALIPVLTISGPLVAGVLSGSFVIELIFAIPGMGPHLVQSVSNRDYPLILGVTLVYSVMLVFANLVVDLLYTVVDPRIKLQA
jgi:oligopeptide transport system permease protein